MEKENLIPPSTTSESLSASGVEKKRPASKDFYVDLPDLTVTQLVQGEPVTVEHDCEHELYCAKTISTYPWLASLNKRDGDPVADRFVMQIWKNRIVAAIADGCSWGPRAYNAALSAIAAYKDYMASRQEIVRDLPEGGHLLLRAFSEGHKRIVEGKEDVWDAGTTTLIGAILAEIPSSWGLLVANVSLNIILIILALLIDYYTAGVFIFQLFSFIFIFRYLRDLMPKSSIIMGVTLVFAL
jgi:hypothetical protein